MTVTADVLQACDQAIEAAARALASDWQGMLTSVSVTCSADEASAREQVRRAEWEAARRGLDVEAELVPGGVKIRFRRLPCAPCQHRVV